MWKKRPAFQEGRLNGIGGKIEPGELPVQAMIREFNEEAGSQTSEADWVHVAEMQSPRFHVYFFRAFGDIFKLRSMTDECIEIVPVHSISQYYTMRNVQWLVSFCLDDSDYDLPLRVF